LVVERRHHLLPISFAGLARIGFGSSKIPAPLPVPVIRCASGQHFVQFGPEWMLHPVLVDLNVWLFGIPEPYQSSFPKSAERGMGKRQSGD